VWGSVKRGNSCLSCAVIFTFCGHISIIPVYVVWLLHLLWSFFYLSCPLCNYFRLFVCEALRSCVFFCLRITYHHILCGKLWAYSTIPVYCLNNLHLSCGTAGILLLLLSTSLVIFIFCVTLWAHFYYSCLMCQLFSYFVWHCGHISTIPV
jgi:hypothetical protein